MHAGWKGARVLLLLSAAIPAGGAEEVSFQNEVMAVLSRAGCNAGVCHGNRSGKGGFKLSLRGQDPEADFLTLTRDLFGRRVDRLEPEKSLVLLKPTAQVPHEGGRRFPLGSPEERILLGWIRSGPRADPPGAPSLLRLEVSPAEQVLVEPEEAVRLTA